MTWKMPSTATFFYHLVSAIVTVAVRQWGVLLIYSLSSVAFSCCSEDSKQQLSGHKPST